MASTSRVASSSPRRADTRYQISCKSASAAGCLVGSGGGVFTACGLSLPVKALPTFCLDFLDRRGIQRCGFPALVLLDPFHDLGAEVVDVPLYLGLRVVLHA